MFCFAAIKHNSRPADSLPNASRLFGRICFYSNFIARK